MSYLQVVGGEYLTLTFVLNWLRFFLLFHRLIRMFVYALAARFGLPLFPVLLYNIKTFLYLYIINGYRVGN